MICSTKAPKCKGLNICFRKHSRYNYSNLNDLKLTAVNFRSLRLGRLWRPRKLRGFSALKWISQPTFQRRINVVSTLCNVVPTLKIKQNPTSDFQRCTMLIQRQCPTLKKRWNNVTQRRNNVAQRWYNVDTTFQASVDVS